MTACNGGRSNTGAGYLDQPGATYSSLMNAGVEIPRGSKSVMIVSHHLMEKKPGGTGTEVNRNRWDGVGDTVRAAVSWRSEPPIQILNYRSRGDSVYPS
jgi:hypothetical protein